MLKALYRKILLLLTLLCTLGLTHSAASAANGAAFVSQSVPASMIVGQSYPVSVTMTNTGTTTWAAGSAYNLGSQNPADNMTFQVGRVVVGTAVAPGQSYTFNFSAKAPSAAGSYNFQFRMLQEYVEWFGASTTNVAVTVTDPPPVNNAAFSAQSVPAAMTTGQTYPITVRMTNTGNTTWPAGAAYKLGSQNPGDNKTWQVGPEGNRVVVGSAVAPGQSYTFSFNVTAPASAGTYNFQWRMVQEFVEWFGASSVNVPVTVSAPVLTNNAAYVTQSVPAAMDAGQSYPVSVTMKNTGTSTWAAGGAFRIGTQNPSDNFNWSTGGPNGNRVVVNSPVAPGASYTFNFNVIAPATGGNYNFQWQMVEEYKAWFGALSTNAVVTVRVNAAALALSCTSITPTVAPQAASASCVLSNVGTAAANSVAYSSIPGTTVSGPTGSCAAQATCGTVTVTTPTAQGSYVGTLIATPASGSAASAPISLVVAAALVNNAAFVSQQVPALMETGTSYPVTVQMKNTGTTTWTAGGAYKLGAENPTDTRIWATGPDLNRVVLDKVVKPNEIATFSFNVTAPVPGTPNFQWRMVEEYKEWFGAKSDNVVVAISPPFPGKTWNAVAAALATGDKTKILPYFVDQTRFDALFSEIGARLPELGLSLSNLNFMEITARYATAQVDQTVDGVVSRHFITFVLVDGAWYISEF